MSVFSEGARAAGAWLGVVPPRQYRPPAASSAPAHPLRDGYVDDAQRVAEALYQDAIDAPHGDPEDGPPRRVLPVERRPVSGERAAIIATVAIALRKGVEPAALGSLLRRACDVDEFRPTYTIMRAALAQVVPAAGFTCPWVTCHRTSYSPNAAVHGYCGNCKTYTGDPLPG